MPLRVFVLAVWLGAIAAPSTPQDRSASDDMSEKRERMIAEQIVDRGVRNPRVLDALRHVERHLFVSDEVRQFAYDDTPLMIGHGQTISQPYIVGLMTEMLDPQPHDRVLEIGTGSGYQAAVLARLVAKVYTIEIVEELGWLAEERLERLGYDNVHVRVGDGYLGWPEEGPFDKIIVTAAPPEVPQALVDQLADPGRMVLPVGSAFQQLILIEKKDGKTTRTTASAVRFVPMVHGEDEETTH
ncbi:MAG: protein-L-isoaspartate(D-aspartate) O-methyltransferase [Candidatus Krumholzibacteriota bacterium]|nr:protein-L-isoaspartate(D-aspartate) O-methyltransferase [Candidatus Krumholzibacteriota bacterium]